MRPILCLALWLAAAPLAEAGAWLREKGDAMLAFSHEATRPKDGDGSFGYTSVYGEYGLTPKLTLGLDAGKGEGADTWKAVVFLRMGREFDWLPGRVATELGLGAAGVADGSAAGLVQPAMSWGHSFETGMGWAWVNVDAKGMFHVAASSEALPETTAGLPLAVREGYKLDATVGLNVNAKTQASVEMRYETPTEGDATLRLVPGVARRIGGKGWVTLGGIVGLRNDETMGVVLGSRIEF